MIRIVPKGLTAGDRIKLLVPAVMTNGITFPPDVAAEVRVVYPGGVIVKSDQATGGLVRLGTPVHRFGDPEPTPEEIMRCVAGEGQKPRVPGNPSERRSENKSPRRIEEWAATVSECGRPMNSGEHFDYVFDLDKQDCPVTGQLGKLIKLFKSHGKSRMLDSEVRAMLADEKEFLKTKQEPYRIFTYYRKALEEIGFLTRPGTGRQAAPPAKDSSEPSQPQTGYDENSGKEVIPSEKEGTDDMPF